MQWLNLIFVVVRHAGHIIGQVVKCIAGLD